MNATLVSRLMQFAFRFNLKIYRWDLFYDTQQQHHGGKESDLLSRLDGNSS